MVITLKGTSHGLIGLATASITQHITISTIAVGPEKALPFLFAYVGALLPDLDIGNSTISNAINPIKMKHVKKLLTIAYLLGSAFAIFYFRQKYLLPTILVSIIAGLSLGSIISETFKILRKGIIIAFGAGVGVYGAYSGHVSLIAVGAFLLALSLSPHRGYSHSLVAVAATFIISKAVFNSFQIPDCSIALTVGMLSHLGADMLTEKGIPVFFPSTQRVSLPITITTGSFVEGVISLVAAVVLIMSIANIRII